MNNHKTFFHNFKVNESESSSVSRFLIQLEHSLIHLKSALIQLESSQIQ